MLFFLASATFFATASIVAFCPAEGGGSKEPPAKGACRAPIGRTSVCSDGLATSGLACFDEENVRDGDGAALVRERHPHHLHEAQALRLRQPPVDRREERLLACQMGLLRLVKPLPTTRTRGALARDFWAYAS